MSSEQLNLAETIKKVHQELREHVHQSPDQAEAIWNAHVANVNKMTEYAQSMRQLAEQHWADKAHGQTRLTWCYETINDYFHSDGLQRRLARDQRKQFSAECCDDCQRRYSEKIGKPCLLDVGSCYNAFASFDDLDTIAIDIAPADPSVHRIDFLRLPQPPLISSHSFDAIVFCLMLDYLPTCRQRLSACLIAHQLLRCLGLLLIVEPDSSLRDQREKSWRQALEKIGFTLVNYRKVTNLHCMAFRKVIITKNVDEDQYEPISQLLSIPQDTMVHEQTSNDNLERRTISADQDLFDELPLNFD